MRAGLLWLLVGLLLGPQAAAAGTEEGPSTDPTATADAASADAARPWRPGQGGHTLLTRFDVGFHGLHLADPIRIHLRLGGFTEGVLGGVDRTRGAVLLMDPQPLWVELDLVGAVTPLRDDRPERDSAGALLPEPIPRDDPTAVRYRLRPTWRSHVGVLLSALLPGTGQFIQEKNRRVGWVFLSAWSFVVAAGVLALVAPPTPPTQERGIIAASFFGIGVGFNVTAAIHAFQEGRRRVPVLVGRGGARLTVESPNE